MMEVTNMPRMARIAWEGGLYHITSRGNNKQQVFCNVKEFDKYLSLIEHYKEKFKFKLYAFVLMINHIHLLLETTQYGCISKIMKPLNQRYAFWHNKTHEKCGHLWEDRFYSRIIDKDSYLLECISYIELNPVRAGLVANPRDYKWSSYLAHAFGHKSLILDTHPIFSELGKTNLEIQKNYQKFVAARMGTHTPIEKVPVTSYIL